MVIQDAKQFRPPVKVIVRGWHDEPVEMLLHGIDYRGKTAQVGGLNGRQTIGLPVGDCFRHSPEVLEELMVAHNCNDRATLRKLYETWRNKHIELVEPVAIDSTHDQEHVAHLERPATRSEQ